MISDFIWRGKAPKNASDQIRGDRAVALAGALQQALAHDIDDFFQLAKRLPAGCDTFHACIFWIQRGGFESRGPAARLPTKSNL